MTKWAMPPLAKVYEALSAVADGRVTISGETSAQVLSSELDKTYTVKWSADGRSVTSNDNATRWQGYTGYPIIAILLETGRIPFDRAAADALAGVPWHALNQQYKRDYDAAVEHVLEQVAERGGDAEAIRKEAKRIYDALAELGLERPEPKGSAGKQARP
jgi:hypothetical protein